MRLLDRFKKWFFKEENVGIINIGDLIQIPGRDYFKNDADRLDFIDKYKEEYLRILSQNRLLSSKDLFFDNLQNEMLMNVDLILRLVVSYSDDLCNKIIKSKQDNEVYAIKLKLYLKRIEEIEKETISRLIALKELEKGRRVSHLNRNALKEQINILTTNLFILMNQKRAINIEINTYLSNMVVKDTTSDDTFAFSKRFGELIDMSSYYIDNTDLYSLWINPETEIAIIERRLEIFCYKNKNLKDELEEIQDIIRKAICFGIPISFNDTYSFHCKDDILKKLNEVEKKYEILIRYGYNVVTQDDLDSFYELKFEAYTYDLLAKEFLQESNQFTYDFTDRELEAYKNILQRKIEKIITGNNPIFNKYFEDESYFNLNRSKAIDTFIHYIKNGSDTFDLESILKDPTMERLSLILAFDKEDGLFTFFNKKILMDNQIFEEALQNSVFTYDDKLPLISIFEIIDPKLISGKYSTYFGNLYKLFSLINKDIVAEYYNPIDKNLKDNLYLPEGIIAINATRDGLGEDNYFVKKVIRKSKNKTIRMSKSLKSISGDLFDGIPIHDITIKEGLEVLGDKSMKSDLKHVSDCVIPCIKIPSTLKQISPTAYDFSDISDLSILFTNFDKSILLNEKRSVENLINLLNTAFSVEKKSHISSKFTLHITFNIFPLTHVKILLEYSSDYKEYMDSFDLNELCKQINSFVINIPVENGIDIDEYAKTCLMIELAKLILDKIEKYKKVNAKSKVKTME